MTKWADICSTDDLQPDSGICALVKNQQVAVFYMPEDNAVYAINNYDPMGKAQVLSRGLIGDVQGEPMVSSPLYKHHFSLLTGRCFERVDVKVDVYAVRVENGRVAIRLGE